VIRSFSPVRLTDGFSDSLGGSFHNFRVFLIQANKRDWDALRLQEDWGMDSPIVFGKEGKIDYPCLAINWSVMKNKRALI